MFTGIISHTGTVRHIDKQGDWHFTFAVEDFTRDVALGASIACSGACLTVTHFDADGFTAQVSKETLDCTTLGEWKEGRRVNFERALKLGDELGGHIVSGHVDGLATLVSVTQDGESMRLNFEAPATLAHFIAAKGSVTLDGISLTVNTVEGARFGVNIIPHTLIHTTMGSRTPGDRVNLEIDMLARYVARLQER